MGGVAVLMKELCECLAKKGFEVAVYTLDLKESLASKEEINGVLVNRHKSVLGDPTYLPSLSFLYDIKKENADVLHVHNIHSFPASFVSLLKKRSQKLVVQTHYHRFGQTSFNNALFTLYKRVVSSVVFKRADAVIVNSSYEEKIVKQDFACSKNIIYLRQGLPMKELKEFHWRPEIPKRILFVGALRKYKNVDRLIRAFRHLLDNETEDLRLVIVGDGPERSNLINLVQKLGVAEHVEWKQNLSKLELFSEYSKARVFVSLSFLESFSRVIHEAQVIGVPVVTFKERIMPDLVSKGMAIGIGSIEHREISAAISKVISMPPKLLNTANLVFADINSYADRVAEVYRKLSAR
jgi:glycosyltransferase involved in cell wall biosynthesis